MTDITKNISQFIEDQFPSLYRDNLTGEITERNRSTIIDFVEAYYEFLEQNRDENFLASRNLFEYRDIDTTLTEFVDHFKSKYLNELPFVYSTDDKFVIKNIIDLYRSKGSEKALKLLVRLLFNEDVEVYYPAKDILRASASEWVKPRYIEVTHDRRNYDLLNTTISGSDSGASAFVENVVTKRVDGKFFDVIYFSKLQNGDFLTGEKVSNDDNFVRAPKIVGSLSDITITSSDSGYSVGDLLNVTSVDGQNGVARVSKTLDIRDNVDFEIEKTGFGYSLDDTEVLISDAVLFMDNSSLAFKDFDIISQPLFRIETGNTNDIAVGDQVDAFNTSSSFTANAIVLEVESTNSIIVEKRSGTFDRVLEIQLLDTNLFSNEDDIEEESSVNLTITNLSGSFVVGERVLQADIINDAYQNIAYGTVASANSSVIQLEESWGEFIDGNQIQGETSGSTADILDFEIVDRGSTAQLLSSTNTSITILADETISSGKKIRGSVSKNVNEITTIDSLGVNEFTISGDNYAINSIDNVTAAGEVIAQNKNVVGLSGNTNPFYFVNNVTNFVYDQNNNSFEFTRIGQGSGANFEIGSLNPNTTETISINNDIIGEENIAGRSYLDIVVGTGEFSGIGRLSSNVSILSSGSGYSNTSSVTLSGGGFNGGEPIIPAQLEVTTDNTGSIVDVEVINQGEGYYETPSVSISDGSGASLELELETGYGFPKLPYGNFNNATISEMLDSTNTVIGEIATLKNINPGSGYDTNVFSKVINREISEYNKYDYVLGYDSNNGSFAPGEIIENVSGVKGRVESVDNFNNTLKVKRLSFVDDFSSGDTITGQNSFSSATITTVTPSTEEDQSGANALVSSNIVLQGGIIDQVEVVNSGFGYQQNRDVILESNGIVAANGIAITETSGIGSGFWRTTDSHLNKQRIQDSFFYQEFSYQIIGTISLKEYEKVVRDVLHVSGTELFGKVNKEFLINNQYDIDINVEVGGDWILLGGIWNDDGVWLENKSWID